MAGGFGGAIKLTGESEYRTALKNISINLKEVSSQLTLTATKFNSNDKSIQNLTAKQEELNKVYEKQESEVKKLRNAYDSFAQKVQDQKSKQADLVVEYNKENAELKKLEQTLGTSSKEYQDQKKIVDSLSSALAKSRTENQSNENALSKMGTALNKAEADLIKTKNEVDGLTKEIQDAQNPTQQLGNDIEDAGEKAKKSVNDGFTVFKGILADLGSKVIQSAINGIKKLGKAVIDLGKESITSYADYEQLIGGVETLFKDSASIIEGYANNAYKTAGLSANEYMETVTSFSASLLQSLGQDTKKATEYANLAIVDMSDNANKMGTSMDMIQNAYQGFAKQNYTMLDNLKLGYGGTKTEMERLIADANKVKEANGEMATLSISSFADMVEAIHIIQTEMGITGTTAKEADSTIQGSTNSMKSAWKNLLTGIADDTQDLSKLVDNFIDSVITAGDNLVPRIKKTVEGIKKLINSVVTQVFPKLKKEIPELKPLITTFEWFIKNKNFVVNSIKAMVTAFAVAKIVQFTKALSDGVKNLIAIATATKASTIATTTNTTAQVANTSAQVAGTVATKALTVATNLLNTAWKSNPIGLVVAGVTALISVFTLLKNKSNEVTEAEKERTRQIEEQTSKINDNKNAWDDLVDSQQNSINAGMTEISNYQSLYDELLTLVDANGKVKDGYEKRASFITSTLSNALGIEISLVDGVIQNYSELTQSIDDLMEKKKAQIILQSQEALYTEAITKQQEALKTLIEIEQQLSDQQVKRSDLEKQLAEEESKRQNAVSAEMEEFYRKRVQDIQSQITTLDEETASIQSNYNEQKNLVSEYAYNIGLYEQNMALAHEGRYNEMSTVTWDYVKDYQNAGEAEKAMLEQRIKETETQLNILKELKDKNNTDIYDAQIKAGEQQLQALQEEMEKYNSTIVTGNENAEQNWNEGIEAQVSVMSGQVTQFEDVGNDHVQAYVNGIKMGEPIAKTSMKGLTDSTINEITKQKGSAQTAGENLIDGVNIGITNQNKQSIVFGSISAFGNSILSTLQYSLQEHSPSKATNKMGRFLLQGLGLGINKEEDNVLKQANEFGKDVISSMQSGLSENSFSNISTQIRSAIPKKVHISSSSSRNTESNFYDDMVRSFKEALSQMKIEMDDEQMGKFVDKTVARAIYS